jgi:hypothetical protein
MGPRLVLTALGVLGAAAFGIYKYATRHKHDAATCPTEAAVLSAIKAVDDGTVSLDSARARMTEWEKSGCVSAVAALRSIIVAKEAKETAAKARAATDGKSAECEAAIVGLPKDARTTLDGSAAPSLYELAQRAVAAERERKTSASTDYFNAAAAIDAEVLTGLAVKFAAASACLKARGIATGAPLTPLHAVLGLGHGPAVSGHRGMHRTGTMRRQDIFRARMRG